MNKKIFLLFTFCFLLLTLSGCDISDYLPWVTKKPVASNPPRQAAAPAPEIAAGAKVDCSKLSGGILQGDGGEDDKNLACCYEQSFNDSCFPFNLTFTTPNLGRVVLSVSGDGQSCSERLVFGDVAQIIDPEKKFYANRNIIYTKKISKLKKIGAEPTCQDRLNSAYTDFNDFYDLPSTLIGQYWNGQLSGFSGNLIEGLVNSCSGVNSVTINGDGSFEDNKNRCCLLENIYLNDCQPFQAVYNTSDLGKVILSLSKNKNNCVAKISYGSADLISDKNKKIYANKYVAQTYTQADLANYAGTNDKTGVLLCQQVFSLYASTTRSDLDLVLNGYLKSESGFSGNLSKTTAVKKSAGDLTKATIKARDQARVSYVKSIQRGLYSYYQNNGQYPPSLSFGQPLIDSSGKSYLPQVSGNPFPNDGDCPADSNFSYQSLNEGQSYNLTFCLGYETDDIPAGVNTVTPENIIDEDLEEELNNSDASNQGSETGTSSDIMITEEDEEDSEENNNEETAGESGDDSSQTEEVVGAPTGDEDQSDAGGSGANTEPKIFPDLDTSGDIKVIQGTGGF